MNKADLTGLVKEIGIIDSDEIAKLNKMRHEQKLRARVIQKKKRELHDRINR